MKPLKIPFVERQPTKEETTVLMLAMSTYRDGTGQEKEKDGSTRPGWRDFERIFAEILAGHAPENKDIFDVVTAPEPDTMECFGISLKSKQLTRVSAIDDLAEEGRVHMELANSPAKFWTALSAKGLTEADFTAMTSPKEFGDTILEVVENWHNEAKLKYELENKGTNLNLAKSVYITVSYTKAKPGVGRSYQVHSFDLDLPKSIRWEFISNRCLRGYDTRFENEIVFDWYGLSGGQLKYYPRAKDSKFCTEQFTLLKPKNISILEKAETYWPEIWGEAA